LSKPVLVIIAKQPQVGTTKTRLSPPLSLSAAAGLFEALLLDTIDLAASVDGIDLAVAVTPPESIPYFDGVTPPGTLLLPVSCPDIGDCLTQVFEQLLGRGYPRVLAFNSDGPSLPLAYIQAALQLLDDHDVVYGPSEDGGYYLVALDQPHPELFRGIEWSTPRVMDQSLAVTHEAGLQVGLLPEWFDVDNAAGLKRLLQDARTLPSHRLVNTRRFLAGLSPQVIESLSN
jgi:rSAM/selenodomain-associated transferase 1